MSQNQKRSFEMLLSAIEEAESLILNEDLGDLKHERAYLNARRDNYDQQVSLSIIGDEGVGSSSLIEALADDYVQDVPTLKQTPMVYVNLKRAAVHLTESADGILFILNATRILSMDERRIIDLLGSQDLNHVLFVVTNIGRLDEDEIEEVHSYVKEALSEYYSKEAILQQHLFIIDLNDDKHILRLKDAIMNNLDLADGRKRMSAEAATAIGGMVIKKFDQAMNGFVLEVNSDYEDLKQQSGFGQRKIEATEAKFERFQKSAKEQVDASLSRIMELLRLGFAEDVAQHVNANDLPLSSLLSYGFRSQNAQEIEQIMTQKTLDHLTTKLEGWIDSIQQQINLDIETLPLLPENSLEPNLTIPQFSIDSITLDLPAKQRQEIVHRIRKLSLIGDKSNDIVSRLIVRTVILALSVTLPSIIFKIIGPVAFAAYEAVSLNSYKRHMVGSFTTKFADQVVNEFSTLLPELKTELHQALDSYTDSRKEITISSIKADLEDIESKLEVMEKQQQEETAKYETTKSSVENVVTKVTEMMNLVYLDGYPNASPPSMKQVQEIVDRWAAFL